MAVDRTSEKPAHGGYLLSLRIRKRIEEAFAWIKAVAGQEKPSSEGSTDLPSPSPPRPTT
jgi:hypothetical protein